MSGFSRRELIKLGFATICSAGLAATAGVAPAVWRAGPVRTVLLSLADPLHVPLVRAAFAVLSVSASVEHLSLEDAAWRDLPSLREMVDGLAGKRLVALVDDRSAVLLHALLGDRAPVSWHQAECSLDLRRTDGAVALAAALAESGIGPIAGVAQVVPGTDRLVTFVVNF